MRLCCHPVRRRLRELGFEVGRFPTGERNALVDVPGVLVGHRTLIEGDRLRTGVTAILPHGGNLYADKVLGACHVINGYGKAAGLSQLEELGTIESPLLLTSTLAVGPVLEGGLRWVLDANPSAAVDRDTVNVLVAECFDGWLSDARSLPVRPEHALEAIAAPRPATRCARARSAPAPGRPASASRRASARPRGHRRAYARLPRVHATTAAGRDLHLLVGPAGHEVARAAGAAGVGRVDRDRARHRRPALRAPAAPVGRPGHVRPGPAPAASAPTPAASTRSRSPRPSGSPTQRRRTSWSCVSCATTRARCASCSRPRPRSCTRRCSNALCAAGPMEGRDGNRAEELPYELLEGAPGVVQEPLMADEGPPKGAPRLGPTDGASVRRHALRRSAQPSEPLSSLSSSPCSCCEPCSSSHFPPWCSCSSAASSSPASSSASCSSALADTHLPKALRRL